MFIDNLSFLLSKLETALDSHLLTDSDRVQIVDSADFYNLLSKLKQELKKHSEKLAQENKLKTSSASQFLENQQLIRSLIFSFPIAIALLDRQMCFIAVSRTWLKDYQLREERIIGSHLSETFPEIPDSWYQDYQNCLAGKIRSLRQKQNHLSWQLYAWGDSPEQILGLLIFSQVNTEKRLLQSKLRSSEAQMRAVFGGMKELVFTIETESNTILILPTNFFELYDDNFLNQVIDKTHAQIFGSPQEKSYQALIQKVLQTQQTDSIEYSLKLNNSIIWFRANISPVSQTTVIWVVRDITEQKEAEKDSLFAEQELAQVTLQSIGDAVITTNNQGEVKYINPVAEQLTGWQAQEAQGQALTKIFQVISENTKKPIANYIQKIARKNRVCKLAAKNILIARHGSEYAIEGLASPMKDRQGKLIGAVVVFRDVTKARQMARKLSWQASHDPLTKLCNRRKFEEYVAKAINDSNSSQFHHAICLMDLDRFKIINDTCGHAAGDELLRQITKLLNKRIRTLDIFARIGGDEFGLLLHRCPLEIAQRIANQLRESITNFRFIWQDKVFRIGVSIGLVAITPATEDLTSLLSTADAACYAAKEKGGNCVYLYREEDTVIAQQRGERQWIEKLNLALEENRFCLYAQKIAAIGEDSSSCHQEILLRLIDEFGNLILPGAFLPAAERYGLMPAIDRWVISTFLAGYEAYCQSRQTSKPPLNFYTINLSGASINSADFGDFLQEQFDLYHIPPATICFEITETVAIANLDDAISLISQLKELGCMIALDDFGSGMSSLNYLKNLPIDYLKIDGSFVINIASDKIDYATVECFSHISQIMEIQTIAEFVENEIILQNLRQIGIDYAQGYGIERPQPLTWV